MSDLLPTDPDPPAGDGDGGDPRVIGVDSDDAADLLAALQSETARDILAALYDEPATPSTLAESVDTSIQNVRYHLDNLVGAELVAVADTAYSEKGREMKVYAPAAKPLVVFAGGDDEAPGVEAALSRLFGGLGILGAASLLVQRFFGGGGGAGPSLGGSEAMDATTTEASANASGDPSGGAATQADGLTGGGDPTTAAEAGDAPRTVTETAPETTRAAGDAATTVADGAGQATTTVTEAAGAASAGAHLPPGLVFFLGGALVLAALGVAWYVGAHR